MASFDEEPLVHFFSSAWFRRLWVVQEAVLAPEHIIFRGPHQMHLLKPLRVASWISYKFLSVGIALRNTPGLLCAARVWTYTEDLHGGSKRTKSAYMLDFLLLRFKPFETSDPRDHVHALLGTY